MNLALLDPFAVAQEYPETLTNTLSYGHSVCIRFNGKGDYLASGTVDGSIVIYDLDTNGGILTVLRDHSRPIQSLSWSKCGRYLLSSSRDWKVNLWDLSNNEIIRSVRFDGPVWMAELHPTSHFVFAASIYDDHPVLVDVTDADDYKRRILQTIPLIEQREQHEEEEEVEEETKKRKVDKHVTLVTTFYPNGEFIFAGTSKGWLNVIQTETLETVYSIKISNSNIKNIKCSLNGRKMIVNSSDRVIRQLTIPDLMNEPQDEWEFEVEQKYQDVVNRLQWNSVSFNHNAEYIIASTWGSAQDVYMWETGMGSLIKILEGPKEELVDVSWNDTKCMIGATGLDSGTVYLWSIQYPQKWSALAPDFVEIEENIEYEEKEDEFDIYDDDELNKRKLDEEDEFVDILSKENSDARGFRIKQSFIIPIDYDKDLDVYVRQKNDE